MFKSPMPGSAPPGGGISTPRLLDPASGRPTRPLGMLSVRFVKVDAGQPAPPAHVATVMPWAVEVCRVPERGAPLLWSPRARLWLNERGGGSATRHINERFSAYREAMGFPSELTPQLSATLLYQPSRRGRRGPALRPAAGRSLLGVHHRDLHLGVHDYKNKMMRQALARAFERRTMTRTVSYRWHLRQVMAQKEHVRDDKLGPLLAAGASC